MTLVDHRAPRGILGLLVRRAPRGILCSARAPRGILGFLIRRAPRRILVVTSILIAGLLEKYSGLPLAGLSEGYWVLVVRAPRGILGPVLVQRAPRRILVLGIYRL